MVQFYKSQFVVLTLITLCTSMFQTCVKKRPIVVINTWPFTKATDVAWEVLLPTTTDLPGSSIDAVVAGCSTAERDPTIKSVGYGNSPDENGHTTLDAMVMDGKSMKAGAVASMTGIREASKVAREVLISTKVTLLVGQGATDFAKSRGFKETSLDTPESKDLWLKWKNNKCQPNFRIPEAWIPDSSKSCGPYQPKSVDLNYLKRDGFLKLDEENHDTIGLVAIDAYGSMAVGTSTSGSSYKIPGRVGDSAIPGAGGYVVNGIGGAVATGDGDLMMRYMLSFEVIQLMRLGLKPTTACELALNEVKSSEPWYGAVIALTKDGDHGAACVGFTDFNYCVRNSESTNGSQVIKVNCMKSEPFD